MDQAVQVLYPRSKITQSTTQTKTSRHTTLITTNAQQRFTQLLLEHGECHLQDWAVVASSRPLNDDHHLNSHTTTPTRRQPPKSKFIMDDGVILISPSTSMGSITGRLRLCSRSVVFEPTDVSRGIVRCPFDRMVHPPTWKDKMGVVQCNRHYVMKTNNVIGPFTNVEQWCEFRFLFLHSDPVKFYELSQTLFHMVKNEHSPTDTTTQSPQLTLKEILHPIHNRPFDPSNYIDARERPLTSNLRCSLKSPLLTKSGCCIVTRDYIYFQPASGVFTSTASKAICWKISDVVATARRYSGLKDVALELYFVSNGSGGCVDVPKRRYGRSSSSGSSGSKTSSTSSSSSSVLLAFETTKERERVLHLLPRQIPCHTDASFLQQAYVAWKTSSISNFEYLLLLNSAAGRTYHDLSRYPVFPWVLSDYNSTKLDLMDPKMYRDLSKPIGALNEKRLDYFRTRFHSMAQDLEGDSSAGAGVDQAFLYGTHYSAPGYVLYYLIRNMPEHMLCLQNGKFDAPDRMFYSIEHTYSSILENHTDVKELIPEFYDPSAGFDFLINARSLQLGTTQTGDRVHDVKLPLWAKSPRDYIKKNRAALESDICTKMLPKWIDLIFGEVSRGEKARDSSNLFHPTAYLGPSDLESMATEEERMQAELQATEFGIVPDLLFCLPHPSKMVNDQEDDNENDNGLNFFAPETGRAVIIEDMNDNDDHDDIKHYHHESKTTSAVDQPWELLDAPVPAALSTDKKSISHEDVLKIDHSWSSESMSSARKTAEEKKMAPTTPARKAKSSWTASKTNLHTVRSDDGFDKVVRNGGDGANGNYHDVSGASKPQHYLGTADEFGSEIDRYSQFSSSPANQSSSSLLSSKKLSLKGSGDSTPEWKQHHQSEFSSPSRKSRSELNSNGGRSSSSSLTSSPLKGIKDRKKLTSLSSPPTSQQEPLAAATSQGWELKQITFKNNMHGDSVSGCSLLLQEGIQNHSFLATVSLDGGLMVHTLPSFHDNDGDNDEFKRRTFPAPTRKSAISRFPYLGRGAAADRGCVSTRNNTSISSSAASSLRKMNSFRTHTSADPLACLVLTSDDSGGHVVFAGGHDDIVLAYGINSGCALASVYSHRDAVTGIDLICRSSFGEERSTISSTSSYLVPSSSILEKSTHMMVSGSWDATVKLWSVSISAGEAVSINREPLAELFDADSSIVSVSATEVNGNGVAICAGCDDGSLVVWMCHDDGKKEVIHKQAAKRGGGACSAVKWVSTQGFGEPKLFVGFETGKLVSYVLTNGAIRPMSKIMLGSAVRCITATDDLVLAGCADGSLQLILVDYDGNLDAASRKWNSVNGNKSPSITCVSIAEDKELHNTRQYICATGHDDGSVVLSKMKEI